METILPKEDNIVKILIDGMTKRFPNREKGKAPVVAVDDFCFEVPDGQLVCLLGPSGCGKSTMLNLISGLEKPTSGKIFFGDRDVTALEPEHRGVGLVFQNYALYPHLTVRKNIMFPLTNIKGKDKPDKQQMLDRSLKAAQLVQIDQLLARKPAELSGGQQQRVAIARALVKLPQVLLLDEPLSNLDARLRLETREEIRRIQRETGITTIFVTHDQEEAMSISDQIVVMQKGRLQQAGKPQQVYEDPTNLFVAQFLGTPAINTFTGEVKGGRLFLGDQGVLEVPGVPEGPVWVGIRPEGFLPEAEGPFALEAKRLQVLGRDRSVLGPHPAAVTEEIRVLLPGEAALPREGELLRCRLKPNKVLLFDKTTQERIRFAGKEEA